ncbi:MAG: polysaccharide biosynthesis protein PslG [Acidimicrobiaceae bacterium]
MTAPRRGARGVLAVALLLCFAACHPSPKSSSNSPPTSTPRLSAAERGGLATDAGFLYESDLDLARDLDAIAATGARWLRVEAEWPEVEKGQGTYDFTTPDRVVAAALTHQLHVLLLLDYTPAWARPPGTTDKYAPQGDDGAASYGRYAGEVAAHYAGQVSAFELWNEPNMEGFWQPKPDPQQLVRLAAAAAKQIRAVQPDATIVLGGLAPAADQSDGSAIAPLTFLRAVYDAGVGPSITAIGIHPYTYPYLPTDAGNHTSLFLQLPALHQVMDEHGDGAKPLWATEFGAPTGGASGRRVSDADQIATVVDAFRQAQGWPWLGPIFWYMQRDTGTDAGDEQQHFGLLAKDFTPKPIYTAFTTLMQG